MISASAPPKFALAGIPNNDMKTEVGVRGFILFFSSFFPTEEAQTSTMEVEDGEDGPSAGRGEGGADLRCENRPAGRETGLEMPCCPA